MFPRVRRFLRTYRLPLVIAACVVAGGIAAALLVHPGRGTAAYSDTDPAFNRAYWQEEIRRIGPAKTYAEFAKRNAQAPWGRQHFAAHVIGALFGEDYGPSGIKYCDAQFSFGCYHGFFSQVIANGGIGLIPKLDQACVAAFGPGGTGCQHGIGHGILEYVGYAKLNEALDLCGQTTHLSMLLGCESGVFMENDWHLAGTADGLTPKPRTIDPAHPYAPCDTVAAKFLDVCYLDDGTWYALQNPNAEKVRAYCDALPKEPRTYCLLGAGSAQVTLESYDPQAALAECQSYTGDDQLDCRAGSWWGFFEMPNERAKGAALCDYPDPAETKRCLDLADFTGGHATASDPTTATAAPGS